MRTLAIANFKGGTGKTATACNLAAILARDGKRVLLIDADAQHNASCFCGFDFDGPTLTDVLQGTGETVWSDNVFYVAEHFQVLPADMRLLTLDLATMLAAPDGGSAMREKRLVDFLGAVDEDGEVDFVLIDCPPSFTAASVAAFVCCDEVILPTKVDAFSRAGALELVAQIRGLKSYHVAPRFRALLTMVDGRTRIGGQVLEQLREDGLEVFETVIHSSVCVSESSYARLPLYEYAPRSRTAQDYEALAREVLGSVGADPQISPRKDGGPMRASAPTGRR